MCRTENRTVEVKDGKSLYEDKRRLKTTMCLIDAL
ncbi:UNVERIFIED_ORG: hypothetical protein BDK47_1594 [Anoxybacillus amylolyticus]